MLKYSNAVEYLENCYKFGSKRGHENLKKLLNCFGNPQEKLKIIHIAGTNGKGSTCTMIASILKESGYKVGLFISPHLQKYNERFIIDDESINDEEFCIQLEKIIKKVNILFKGKDEYFSFFEIITCMAFNYFYENNVNYAVIEVGMGGRLDATNIIKNPVLSVITKIDFDHMVYLGNTIEDIAREKGGIIKNNCATVLYCQDEKVYNIIKEICSKKNSVLYYTKNYNINIKLQNFYSTVFNIQNEIISYDNVYINMSGDYQIYNACNALIAVKALKDKNIEISEKAILNGLKKVHFQGRMEIVSKKPFIMLDGAHNENGAEEFNLFLKKFKEKNKGKIILLIGILKDKQYTNIANIITEYADTVIITKPYNKRYIEPSKIYDTINKCNKEIFVIEDLKQAFEYAVKCFYDDYLFCIGSLYLIGDIKNILWRNKND